MKEKDMQTLFGRWLKAHPSPSTETYELKIVKNGPFAFDKVAPHQVDGLLNAKQGLYVKLQDMSAANGFANPKPWDCVWVKAYQAWVCVLFYEPRKPKIVYKIPIERFLEIRSDWKRKSIRREELEQQRGIEQIILS